ncbi:DUF2088 domain-containing protein, partial [Paenibacillus sepulcri]|nr:DUF2088 domain-containing protein [Paenibacillus sepulcri]
ANWNVPEERARIARIVSTLHVEHVYVSESVYEEIQASPNIETEGGWEEFRFDEDGNLPSF